MGKIGAFTTLLAVAAMIYFFKPQGPTPIPEPIPVEASIE